MSAAQRTKGAAAERELCHLLTDELGFVVRRNVDQARAGGADCLQVPGHCPHPRKTGLLAVKGKSCI
jgi:Holliday junction resolvase